MEERTLPNPFQWGTQLHRIYEFLSHGPKFNYEIQALRVMKYTSRMTEMRTRLHPLGWTIRAERVEGGVWCYRLERLPEKTRPDIRRTADHFRNLAERNRIMCEAILDSYIKTEERKEPKPPGFWAKIGGWFGVGRWKVKRGIVKLAPALIKEALQLPSEWKFESLQMQEGDHYITAVISGSQFPDDADGIKQCTILVHKESISFEVREMMEATP